MSHETSSTKPSDCLDLSNYPASINAIMDHIKAQRVEAEAIGPDVAAFKGGREAADLVERKLRRDVESNIGVLVGRRNGVITVRRESSGLGSMSIAVEARVVAQTLEEFVTTLMDAYRAGQQSPVATSSQMKLIEAATALNNEARMIPAPRGKVPDTYVISRQALRDLIDALVAIEKG